MANATQGKDVHVARAKSVNLPISTKHSIEISRFLRGKSVSWAVTTLGNVALKKQAVPFVRFNNDMGHKAGMSAGRYPVKAATHFLTLVKSVRANAEDLGLNVESLVISKILANKASTPFTGGRNRGTSKRTHVEIEVREIGSSSSSKKKAVKAKKSTKAQAGESQ